MNKMLVLLFLFGTSTFSQQRYIVSPAGEAIPLKRGESAESVVIKERKSIEDISYSCTNKFVFGYPDYFYEPSIKYYLSHKERLSQWFVPKATGRIDTIYWWGGSGNSCLDSLVSLTINYSHIGPDYGPGVPPYPAPCQSWGYWLNTLDFDNGIAPHPEEATDTTWYSTINTVQNGKTIPQTRPPTGDQIWGQGSAGYGATHRPGLNKVGMMITGLEAPVTVGKPFFINFRANQLNKHVEENPDITTHTSFYAWDGGILPTTSDENWPSRVWKFYEHDSGPERCAGLPREELKRGWFALGNTNFDDTMSTALLNVWYLMTAITNVPPVILPTAFGDLQNTFDTGDRELMAEIVDCDPSDPGNTAVTSAVLQCWTRPVEASAVDFLRQTDIPMSVLIGDVYVGTIPGQPAGTEVKYRIVAEDNQGLSQTSPFHSYKVVTFENHYYMVETTATFTHHSIAGTGTEIDTADFFSPPGTGLRPAPKDDGTAGPYSLGGGFPFFGDTMFYAWVGVNGAIALSKGINDTIDVNSNGLYTSSWDFPCLQHHYRKDIHNIIGMPPNFIAPMWADFIIGNDLTQYGHIRYQDLGSEFVVEYDSLGTFARHKDAEDDINTFRIVLHKDNGEIEFQYVHPGTNGQDSSCLVGMQMDSTSLCGPEPGYIFVNRNTYPHETKPRENWSIKFIPGGPTFAKKGWNLLSVARTVADYSKAKVFPGAISDAFKFTTAYVTTDPLINGQGVWLKYGNNYYAGTLGVPMLDVYNRVKVGWNMIGTISEHVPTANVQESTPGMVISPYYGYDTGYTIATTLLPGFGYWVKVSGAGTLRLQPPAEGAPKASPRDYTQINRIVVQDRKGNRQTLYFGEEGIVKTATIYTGDMPPAAPEFDARFKSTQGMVVTYPSGIDDKVRYEHPISVSGLSPVTVSWEIVKPAEKKFSLTLNGQMVADMEGSGSVRIKNANGLAVTLNGGAALPKVFALGENYPNPFNPVTRFRVDVPKVTDVQVVVYDVLGRKISALMSGETLPGSYDLEWNAQNVPTGIYFIRMIACEFTSVQKAMLMK